MLLPIRSLLSLLAIATLAQGAIVYRPRRVDEAARHNLLPRQGSSSSSAAASSAAALNNAENDSPKFTYGTADPKYPGVVATGPMGSTNPSKPSLNTAVNQTSMSRLATVNSVDDWCTFGPPDNSKTLGDVEGEVVAYCTKARNNARVIPDGTVTAAHFVKTPLYVQIMALGDFTKINFQKGDSGGELDPHGATGLGNPVGGNVTSNITGSDVFYEEWMNYVSHELMCFRICIAGSDGAPPSKECQHSLDEVGCYWIMPGNYYPDQFESCDADAAYPPGIYVSDGSTSSFQQYATGIWTDDGEVKTYTNGSKGEETPTAAQSQPSSSNCKTYSTIANNIASLAQTSSGGSGSSSSKKSSGSSDSTSQRSSAMNISPALLPIGVLFAAFVVGSLVL
ncbi:hypothetical protein MPSI1_001413 [Malassezia psittaci]|uniref:Uncharacterized protein n=1 Tax=Malassezia psittaci TaxID=1821823 RepID=A0AAF0JDK8_9BASI|nr:hypothetical protein MPSI1_001413 [Malassezia psittaci]